MCEYLRLQITVSVQYHAHKYFVSKCYRGGSWGLFIELAQNCDLEKSKIAVTFDRGLFENRDFKSWFQITAISNHGVPNRPLHLNVGDNRCGGNDRPQGFYPAKWMKTRGLY